MQKILCMGFVLLFGTMAFAMKDSNIQDDQCLLLHEEVNVLSPFDIELEGIKFHVFPRDPEKDEKCYVFDGYADLPSYCYRLEVVACAQNVSRLSHMSDWTPIGFQIPKSQGFYEFRPVPVKKNGEICYGPTSYKGEMGYDYLMQEIVQKPLGMQQVYTPQVTIYNNYNNYNNCYNASTTNTQNSQVTPEVIEIDSDSGESEDMNVVEQAKIFSPKIIFNNEDTLLSEYKGFVKVGGDLFNNETFDSSIQDIDKEQVAITCLQENLEKKLQQKLKRKRDEEASIIKDAKFLLSVHEFNAKKGNKKRRNTKKFNADEIFTWCGGSSQCIYGPVDVEKQTRPKVSFEESVRVVCGDNKHMHDMVSRRFKRVFESFQASPEKIKKFFDLLETGSFPDVLKFFIENKIFDAKTNSIELKQDTNDLIDVYTMFLEIMLDNYVEDKDAHDVILFNIAKRLFALFFETEKKYKEVVENGLEKKNNHPFLRFCYSVMHYHLTREGWMHWSKDALDALKIDYDNGQEIVYIGGGCDICELLTYGIYNIRIIDPFLEGQVPFYTKQDFALRAKRAELINVF